MADLLAKQDTHFKSLSRGQEVEGTVVLITSQEIILDLGTKSEGVLPKKDLSTDQAEKLAVGDHLRAFVVHIENESGQVVLASRSSSVNTKSGSRSGIDPAKLDRFKEYLASKKVLIGKGLEVNKGGLVVEVNNTRGFLPISQVSLSRVNNIDELVGKELSLVVLEVNDKENKLIFSQKNDLSAEAAQKLTSFKEGELVKGQVVAILPFGIGVSVFGQDSEGESKLEGLVHISEVSWEKTEDLASQFKMGDQIEAKVLSIDPVTNRLSLSIKSLKEDPFAKISTEFTVDDVIKGKVSKVNSTGISFALKGGVEGFMAPGKVEADSNYEEGQEVSLIIDGIDNSKRRVNVVPFITSTSGLIYK